MNGERNPDDRGETASAGCPRSSCLQLFVDGELDPTPASDLEAHLAACATCADRAALLVATKASVRRTCGGRANDALRAKICLALTREVAAREAAVGESLSLDGGVAAELVAAAVPSRESLVHGDVVRRDLALRDGAHRDRAHLDGTRGDSERRRARVAYGVGALALAAGMALAVVGERAESDGQTAERGGDRRGDDDAARPATVALAGETKPAAGLGLPEGVSGAAPGRLVPVSPMPAAAGPTLVGVGAPSLAPSAIAGRHLAGTPVVDGRTTIDAVLDDLVIEHMNPLPPEEDNVKRLSRFERTVGVAMRPPTFRKYDARFRGARLLPLRGGAQRSATAMLTYELPGGERVTVYLWNPQAVPIGATRLQPRTMREAREARGGSAGDPAEKAPIYVGESRGYSVAACERRGVGYALATERDPDESVRMVAAALP